MDWFIFKKHIKPKPDQEIYFKLGDTIFSGKYKRIFGYPFFVSDDGLRKVLPWDLKWTHKEVVY